MSDTTNGTGGFGQFSDRYRDRWAALHPKAAPAAVPTPTPLSDSRQRAAGEPEEMAAGTSASVLPKALGSEVRTIATPFGRRRIRPPR
jgi:hypothetical protein